jgi:dipeptidyl aminopeptidase/acylaminoacyl peptidase
MINKFTFLVCIILFIKGYSQDSTKKNIDYTTYDSWNTIGNTILSPYGNWVSYEINPNKGDGNLFIYNSSLNRYDTINRGYSAMFSPNADFLVFKIKPPLDTIRKLKIDKKKPDDFPKDSLGIFLLGKNQLIKEAPVKSFKIPVDSSSWFVWQKEKVKEKPLNVTPKPKPEENTINKKNKKCICRKNKKEEPVKADAKPLAKNKNKPKDVWEIFITNPILNKTHTIKGVSDYTISENGLSVAYIKLTGDTTDSCYVYSFNTTSEKTNLIFSEKGTAKNITLDKQGKQAAFIFSADTGIVKYYSLHYSNLLTNNTLKVADSLSNEIPEKWGINEFGKISFSEYGNRLFFETAPRPTKPQKDTLPDDEKPKVDIWNWQDKELQTQQLHNLENEKKNGYRAFYNINEKRIIQLENKLMRNVYVSEKGEGEFGIGYDNTKYQKEYSWNAIGQRDAYLVDLNYGNATLVLENKSPIIGISNFGKYILWFNTNNKNWHVVRTSDLKDTCITCNIKTNFYRDDVDVPSPAFPYGLATWTENDKYILLYDKYDIWVIDPTAKNKPYTITQELGKKNNITFRFHKTNTKNEWISHNDTLIITGLSEQTKDESVFLTSLSQHSFFEKAYECNCNVSMLRFIKAQNNSTVVCRPMSFTQYPDLILTNFNNFNTQLKITDANPQKSKFIWGSVELIKWKNFKNKEQAGLLYKPENFDANKKYPMLVYFYEKFSDNLHLFHLPRPSYSTIGISEYVSSGYIVFVPDISYSVGNPGKSAYDDIVSGTQFLISKGFVNKDKIGLQGQSWGGYQTAYLITQTNLYKAAMAGAPVSNMTSAYGGIRWESGNSRMTQYEHGQSRIGKNLWEARDLYIQNSPLFFADKVNTPVLIMANDNDGAVPWYQGIEFFVALRRLNKPSWMLNYNGDQHNLTKYPNRVDLSIRMKQFFDHYLMDKPAPEWMTAGIPALEKGKNNGLKLIEEKK